MSNAKHTPGPWDRNIKPARRYPTIFAGRNTHVCALANRPDDEMEANAALIMAAPDLLAAAVAMRSIDSRSTRADVDKACNMLDAAIAKATDNP